MPSVVGLTEGAASTAITNAGIAYEFTYYTTSGATAQNNGYVQAQDPAPGTVGTCGYTVNAALTLYSYTAPTTTTTSSTVPITTTTTTTTASYPTLLSGYHYCASGDAPNPNSPCPSNGSGTGVNCVNNGASGASCPDPNATTTTTTSAVPTTYCPSLGYSVPTSGYPGNCPGAATTSTVASTTTTSAPCISRFRCNSYDVTNSASANYYQCYNVGDCDANSNSAGTRAACCA
jgi:hypothetical protein